MASAIRGRYEPRAVVGAGAQGELLCARDRVHDRLVALKVRHLGPGADRDDLLAEAWIPAVQGLPDAGGYDCALAPEEVRGRRMRYRWGWSTAPRPAVLAVMVAAFTSSSSLVVAPARAAVVATATVNWPDTTIGEQHQTAMAELANLSTPPESASFPTIRFGEITVYPACTTTAPDCAGGVAEGGVYAVSAVTGQSTNPACGGAWTVTDLGESPTPRSRYRLVPPQGEGTLRLAPGETCPLTFAGGAERVPTTDVQPAVSGVQTHHILTFTPLSPDGVPLGGRSGGSDVSTVHRAIINVSVFVFATADTAPAKTRAHSTVSAAQQVAGSRPQPTGTLTLALYGPDDPACTGIPAFQDVQPVQGTGLAILSSIATIRSPGTYRWTGAYSGDRNWAPAGPTPCANPGSQFTFTPRRPAADFDGDLKTDLSVIRPESHSWLVDKSAGGSIAEGFGDAGSLPAPAEYGRLHIADVAVYRPASSTLHVRPPTHFTDPPQLGEPGGVPVPADYDGDGDADPAVFRSATAEWVLHLGFNVTGTFGAPGDIPVPADYDGDGVDDIAVFRPSTATWFVNRSSGGLLAGNFGVAGDVPVPGDYDGDALIDVAVFRPATATWFVDRSSGGLLAGNFGVAGDVPVPGDYDGDLKDDIAVFRPTTGTWFVNTSTGGVLAGNYGVPGDVPLPLPTAVWLAFYGNPF